MIIVIAATDFPTVWWAGNFACACESAVSAHPCATRLVPPSHPHPQPGVDEYTVAKQRHKPLPPPTLPSPPHGRRWRLKQLWPVLGKVVEGRLRGASLARLGTRPVVEHHGIRSLRRGEEALAAKLLVAALSLAVGWQRQPPPLARLLHGEGPSGFLPAPSRSPRTWVR